MAPTTDTTTELPERPTFQQAFEAARAQHSTPAEEPSTETEPAAADEASTEAEPEKGTSPSRKGQAEPATVATATTKEGDGLLSDEEFSTLQTTHADNPAALRKALEGAFTKKTQALSEQRRSVERLQQYADLIDAYEDDPVATIRELARTNGLTVAEATEALERVADKTASAPTAEDRAAAVVESFRKKLGPDLEYLADGLAPAILELVTEATKPLVESAVEPLKRGTESLLTKAASEATDGIMHRFGESHPDWQEHEPAMMELAQKLQPNGMTELEYLENLYAIVTRGAWEKERDAKVAEGVKAAVKKMQKGADTTEKRERTTPDSEVQSGPPNGRVPTFAEAAAAAKRGERWG